MAEGIPRRAYLDRLTEAELKIHEALVAVEALGAHPTLTKAVILLSEAKDCTADWIDEFVPNPPVAEKRGLTFGTLRKANVARLPLFKNKHGKPAHSEPDGSDWSPAQWLQAVLGELGEYANVRKKFERGDLTREEFTVEAVKELADVQCYLDLLAFRLGISLSDATIWKWNNISERVGCSLRISIDGQSLVLLPDLTSEKE